MAESREKFEMEESVDSLSHQTPQRSLIYKFLALHRKFNQCFQLHMFLLAQIYTHHNITFTNLNILHK